MSEWVNFESSRLANQAGRKKTTSWLLLVAACQNERCSLSIYTCTQCMLIDSRLVVYRRPSNRPLPHFDRRIPTRKIWTIEERSYGQAQIVLGTENLGPLKDFSKVSTMRYLLAFWGALAPTSADISLSTSLGPAWVQVYSHNFSVPYEPLLPRDIRRLQASEARGWMPCSELLKSGSSGMSCVRTPHMGDPSQKGNSHAPYWAVFSIDCQSASPSSFSNSRGGRRGPLGHVSAALPQLGSVSSLLDSAPPLLWRF